MKYISLLLTIIVLTALAAGCSMDGGDNSEQSTNAEAVSELSTANITDAKVALAEGTRLLDENQTESAIEFLQHSVSLDPNLAEGHFKLGIAFALLEMQYEQERVVIETPSNSNTGRTKPRSERSFERAVTAYEKWLDANPEDDAAHFNLGRTYSKLTKDEEAEKAFKEAVKLKPDDTEYQTELGAILIKLAKYHEAIAPLKKAIELDAENVRAEDLLEDAQAGRQRLDYVSPKPDANKPATNANSSSNSEIDSNSNTRPPPRPTNTNSRPSVDPSRKPTPAGNRIQ